MTEAVTYVIVGYTTTQLPEKMLAGLTPEFYGKAGTKDPELIQKQIQEKREAWNAETANMPYTGTFSSVHIAIPSQEEAVEFVADGRKPFGTKACITSNVVSLLATKFKDAWNPNSPQVGKQKVIFLGFNTRNFLKMLGIESTMPWTGMKAPAPLGLWYGNSDHRDIEDAVLPKDYKHDWKTVVNARKIGLAGESLEKYEQVFAAWHGPGMNAKQDVLVTLTLAQQLGFFN